MTRTRTIRRPLLRPYQNSVAAGLTALVVAALLLATAACGGSPSSNSSDGTDGSDGSEGSQQSQAMTWAEDVCSAASDWKDAINSALTTLSDKANLSANGVRDAVDTVAAATDSLVADLTSLGTPDTTAGDQAQAQLTTLATQLQQQKDTITSATSQSATTARDLLTQVSTVTGALATMLDDVTTTVDDIRQLDGADELENAFQDAPTCQQLQASASASPSS